MDDGSQPIEESECPPGCPYCRPRYLKETTLSDRLKARISLLSVRKLKKN